MSPSPTDGAFKPTAPRKEPPTASRRDSRSDSTTKAAKEIIESEAAARNAKTARLRAARLAHEAAQPAPPAKKAARKR